MPLVWTLLLNAPLGLAGYWVARHALRIPAGLPRGLAAVTLAWAWATLGMEVLGIAGFLTYGALLGWTSAGLVIAGCSGGVIVRSAAPAESSRQLQPNKDQAWEVAAILAVGLVIWTFTRSRPELAAGAGQGGQRRPDLSPLFRGAVVEGGAAIRGGRPRSARVSSATSRPSATSGSPGCSRAGGASDWRRSASCRSASSRRWRPTACARRLGAGASAAVIATTWFAAVFPFLLFTLEANVDTIFVAAYLVGGVFLPALRPG